MTRARSVAGALAAAASLTAVLATGGCSTQVISDRDFLRSARLIVGGTSMDDLTNKDLVDYAKAICSDLSKADTPDDVAFHDVMSLVDAVGGVDSEKAGWFTYRATQAYCPDFMNLHSIRIATQQEQSSSSPQPSETVVAAPELSPTIDTRWPTSSATTSTVATPAPSRNSKPAPTAATSGALKVGTWRTLGRSVSVSGVDDLDGGEATVRIDKARITQSRDADGATVPALQLRVRNTSETPMGLSLEVTFTGDVEAWFGGAAGSSLSLGPGEVGAITLPYENLSGYAVPLLPKSYRIENMTVDASAGS